MYEFDSTCREKEKIRVKTLSEKKHPKNREIQSKKNFPLSGMKLKKNREENVSLFFLYPTKLDKKENKVSNHNPNYFRMELRYRV